MEGGYNRDHRRTPRRGDQNRRFQPRHEDNVQPINRSYQAKMLKFTIEDPGITPVSVTTHYQLETMVNLRDSLNEQKSRMDGFATNEPGDNSKSDWLYFQSIIDIYRPLKRIIAETANARNVTNAWLKYWEIYTEYTELLPPIKADEKIFAFFNAELPGAALTAFNHFMKTSGRDFIWRASSLVPSEGIDTAADLAAKSAPSRDNTALGDTYGIFANNRDNWLMNKNNDGDVTNINNLRDWAARIGPKSPFGGCHIYSHDAGIDVSGMFNQQETANLRIHLGCALAAFMTMRKEATFIAKQYTFFESLSWSLIIIYASMFAKFQIIKPLTSRPYNSEIYLIGFGFKGIPDHIEKLLTDRLENFHMGPLFAEGALASSTTLSEVQRAARIIFTQQKMMIMENIELYNQYRGRLKKLSIGMQQLSRSRCDEWLQLHPVPMIKDVDRIKSNE
jgi:hypothetical protein